jgi:aconitase A
LRQAKSSFTKVVEGAPAKPVPVRNTADSIDLTRGAVFIAAITSCTNTTNPS